MTTLIQKQKELFDEKFPKVFIWEGEHVDANQDGYTSCEEDIKSFLTTCLIEHYEENIRKLKGKKKRRNSPRSLYKFNGEVEQIMYYENDSDPAFNSALSLAIAELDEAITHLKK